MVIFHIVLRDFALIDFGLLSQEIHGVGLLQKRIALVFLVAENAADGRNAPFFLAAGSRNTVSGQFSGNAVVAHSLQEHGVDLLDDDGLLWVDHQVSVRPTVVTEETVKRNSDLTVCKALSLAPRAVLGNAATFFLRKAGHDGQEQFALAIKGPDVFFFKIHLDAFFLELANGSQAIDCVSSKSAD